MPKNIKELLEQRKGLVDQLKAAETMEDLEQARSGIEAVDAQVKVLEERANLVKSLGTRGRSVGVDEDSGSAQGAKSLGEHFVKFREGHESASNRYVAPPFRAKAAGDPTTSAGLAPTEYDLVPVRREAAPLTVLDLFARKTVSGPNYSWNVYESTTGSVGTTAEGATKNKLTYEYEPKTATLQKVTGFIKLTEELFDDAPYVAQAINQDLVDDLEANRQTQAVATLLGTSGIMTGTTKASATAIDIADAIIDAIADIDDATHITPDAVVLAPNVWKVLAKAKNTLNEYVKYEPLGDIAMIKCPDVTASHVIVGCFERGGELVSKADGVRVDSTNSNDTDFEKNLVSIRAEAREILAVKRPGCFCDITVA